jgi:hypothetical protein
MVITEHHASAAQDMADVEPSTPDSRRRPPTRKVIAAVAIALAAGAVVGVALTQERGSAQPDGFTEPPARSRDEWVRDLVDSRVVPAASLDDGSRIVGHVAVEQRTDGWIRELVESGLVPAATLSDGVEVVSPTLRRGGSGAGDVVRDLVERGVVPAATLGDGTEIVGPALQEARPSRDDVVRNLVERGVVPAASLDE